MPEIGLGYENPRSRTDFDKIPWCAALLNAPGVQTFEPRPNRKAIQHDDDQFLGRTLNCREGVPAYVGFHKDTLAGEAIVEGGVLFSLGKGVNGYPGAAHGGMVAALLDEAMGILLVRNLELGKLSLGGGGGGRGMATARMDVTFRRPVRAPGVVVGRAWLGKVEGKRYKMRAELRDGDEQLLASCDGLWLALDRPNL